MERVKAALRRLGIEAADTQIEAIRLYLTELERWNRKVGLVARSGDLTAHVIDSIRGVPLVRELPGKLIADAGSGGGLPGIPLAVLLPQRRFVLIERSARKTGFLRYAAAVLGTENIEVRDCGLETFGPEFDGVVFRALGDLKTYIPTLLGITVPGGWVLGYKGKRLTAETELNEAVLSGNARGEIVPAPEAASGEAGPERTFLLIRKDSRE